MKKIKLRLCRSESNCWMSCIFYGCTICDDYIVDEQFDEL